jgi:hypothetical protein
MPLWPFPSISCCQRLIRVLINIFKPEGPHLQTYYRDKNKPVAKLDRAGTHFTKQRMRIGKKPKKLLAFVALNSEKLKQIP